MWMHVNKWSSRIQSTHESFCQVILAFFLESVQVNDRFLTSYFCFMFWYCSSNFSASSWRIQSHSSLAFSLEAEKGTYTISDGGSSNARKPFLGVGLISYLSLSSLRWSTFNSLRRSFSIFLFFSLSVCFLVPGCVCWAGKQHVWWHVVQWVLSVCLWDILMVNTCTL